MNKIQVEIDVYNRIHQWSLSLWNTERALDLYNFFETELFTNNEKNKRIPIEIAHSGHKVSLDAPAIYYMQIFSPGYGAKEKMCSNMDKRIESIRNNMVAHVCLTLSWSEAEWNEFHTSIVNLRNQIVAHFDASDIIFENDNTGYSLYHPLMKPIFRENLRLVVISMKDFIKKFEIKTN